MCTIIVNSLMSSNVSTSGKNVLTLATRYSDCFLLALPNEVHLS